MVTAHHAGQRHVQTRIHRAVKREKSHASSIHVLYRSMVA